MDKKPELDEDTHNQPINRRFIVKAEIEFDVQALSIISAYKEFREWLVEKWTEEIKNREMDKVSPVIPCDFHGISVTRVG